MDLELPLIGMGRERHAVETALRNRRPLLLLGDRGVGKSKVLRTALSCCEVRFVYVSASPVLHDFLVNLAGVLANTRHQSLERLTKGGAGRRRWSTRSSIHLRGVLWKAIEDEPLTIVLDGVNGAGARMYRFLQRVYHTPGVNMIAAARDVRGLDMLGRLFWDPRATLRLQPLNPPEAACLFDLLIARLGLHDLEIEEFRARALESARGNPGQIVEMCRLAADPRYWSGRHILFAPLRIDAYARMLA